MQQEENKDHGTQVMSFINSNLEPVTYIQK